MSSRRKVRFDKNGEPHPVFKVVERDAEMCLHDTGLMHHPSMDCEMAEMLSDLMHLREDDPEHEELWHSGNVPEIRL
jgi:hypothetical protein